VGEAAGAGAWVAGVPELAGSVAARMFRSGETSRFRVFGRLSLWEAGLASASCKSGGSDFNSAQKNVIMERGFYACSSGVLAVESFVCELLLPKFIRTPGSFQKATEVGMSEKSCRTGDCVT